MPSYGGTGSATLLHENRQAYLFQQEEVQPGTASVAVMPERIRNSPPAGVSFQIYFTDANGNPANPGIFEVDIQDSDIDQDIQYCPFVAYTGSLSANFIGRVEIPALYGKYVRVFLKAVTNPVFMTVYITNFSGVGGGVVMSTNALPDAPQDGILYGREDGNWVAAVPLAGGTMTGPLILSSDPTQPLQAATMEFVDTYVTEVTQRLSGIVTFAGTIDGPTGDCNFYGPLAGDPSGPLPAASAANNNYYFICTATGTPPSGPIAGQALTVGDWVLSSNSAWVVIDYSIPTAIPASEISVAPPVLGASDGQTALQNLAANDALYVPLAGGAMTGALSITIPPSTSATTLFLNGGGSAGAATTANNQISMTSSLGGRPQWITSWTDVAGTGTSEAIGFYVNNHSGAGWPTNAVFAGAFSLQPAINRASIVAPYGTVSAPGLVFGAGPISEIGAIDWTTGFYRPTANQIGVAVSGVQVALFNSSGISTSGGFTATGQIVANGGIVDNGPVTASGVISANGGLNFGSQVAANAQDLSKHIALYGSTFGLCITSSTVNYNSSANHVFYYGGTEIGRFNSGGLNITNGNVTFGNTNQGYLNWINNTTAASGPNTVVQANDSSSRMLFRLSAQQSGNIVGGNPEGTFHFYTNNGGWGNHHTFWSLTSSPTQVQSEGPMNAPAFNVTSDRKLKKNIREAEEHEHRDAFARLKPVRFNWAYEGDDQWNRLKWGFVADEMHEHLISTGEEGMKSYDAVQVLALAVAEIQRLNKRIERLDRPWYRKVGEAFNGNGHKSNGRVRETVNGYVSKLVNALRLAFTRRKHAGI